MVQIILFILAIGALLIALAMQKRWTNVRNISQGLLISYVFIIMVLGAGELYFRYIYDDSRMEFALTKDNWRNKYVEFNDAGYRDRNWTDEELAEKTSVFVVGDSFTEGWGINDPSDRYTDVLAENLGDDYAVVNVGYSGRATYNELEALRTYPQGDAPDVVVWQYFLNDIDIAAKSNGMPWDVEVPEEPWIAQHSYLASFIFWRLNDNRLYVNIHDGLSEWEYLYAAYDNAYIWDIHKAEIQEMIDYVEAQGAELVVVIFPNMVDPFASIPYVDRVEQAMREYGVENILKLTDMAASWELEERLVSGRDSHASAAFSREVGQMLYEQFFTEDAS